LEFHKVFKGINFIEEMEEKREHHSHEHSEHHHKGSTLESMRKNPWMVVSIVLAVILIALVVFKGFGGGVSGTSASQNLISYIASLGKGEATLVNVTEDSGMYLVNVNYQGQAIPVYVSLDGKFLIPDRIPLSTATKTTATSNTGTQQPTNVPKNDKPLVELFVMSYCPYGTQAEKGMLPVANLLKDKIDFKIRFVYYAMHPTQGEVQENLRQYCIQRDQKAKFNDYLKCFLTAGDSPGCLTSTGINTASLKTCTDEIDAKYSITANLNDKTKWLSGQFPMFNIDKEDNTKYSIQSSPTLVINGVQVSAGRDSVSILKAVCGAFNNAPSECSTQLDATTPGPGFGWDSAGSANLAQCG
jgi:hypothetical protein